MPLLQLWINTVPAIQKLKSTHQHDLARIICDREPIANPPAPQEINRIAHDLRAVAIEISQRRSFQDRYADDLQVALDAGTTPASVEEKRLRAAFKPPPLYDPSPVSSAGSSPQHATTELPNPNIPAQLPTHIPPQSPVHLSVFAASPPYSQTQFPRNAQQPQQRPVASTSSGSPSHSPRSPTFLPPEAPIILTIRETLYASIGEVLAFSPTLREGLERDPPRATFAAVALAILEVSLNNITPNGSVRGVMGNEVTLAQCPPQYQRLMLELGDIGKTVKGVTAEDDERAIKCIQTGQAIPEPRADRLRRTLEFGVQADDDEYERRIVAVEQAATAPPPPTPPRSGRSSGERLRRSDERRRSEEQARRSGESNRPGAAVQPTPSTNGQTQGSPRRSLSGTTIQIANRINALALRLMQLPAFREKQAELFKTLQGVY